MVMLLLSCLLGGMLFVERSLRVTPQPHVKYTLCSPMAFNLSREPVKILLKSQTILVCGPR